MNTQLPRRDTQPVWLKQTVPGNAPATSATQARVNEVLRQSVICSVVQPKSLLKQLFNPSDKTHGHSQEKQTKSLPELLLSTARLTLPISSFLSQLLNERLSLGDSGSRFRRALALHQVSTVVNCDTWVTQR